MVVLKAKYLDVNDKPIIIYSDGCTYQNRNAIMANALLSLSKDYHMTIIQKYLVKGHTQMECDSVHATIVSQSKSDRYNLTKLLDRTETYLKILGLANKLATLL